MGKPSAILCAESSRLEDERLAEMLEARMQLGAEMEVAACRIKREMQNFVGCAITNRTLEEARRILIRITAEMLPGRVPKVDVTIGDDGQLHVSMEIGATCRIR